MLQLSPENILISNGSGHAISLVISAFVDIGDPVICEAPTFMGTLNTLRRHGAELQEVPLDDGGSSPRRCASGWRHCATRAAPAS